MKVRLQISEPCTEDWNKMSILEKGKYCNKCQKKVTDFSRFEKDDILDFLNKNEKLCGRLDQSQLNEDFFSNRTRNISLSKLAFFFCIGGLLGFSESGYANLPEHKTEVAETNKWKSILPKKEADSITIEGIVLDPEGLELPGVNIWFKGTEIFDQTDFSGRFSITMPLDSLKEENFLIFSYLGFESLEYRFYQNNRYLNIKLKLDTAVMGEVVIIHRDNIFRKIRRFFSNLF